MAGSRSKGEGSNYRHKDGRWVDQHEAARKRQYVYGETRKEVARELTKAIADREARLVFDSQKLILTEYLDR